MSTVKQSDMFKNALIICKIFAIWPGRKQSLFYKYFSTVYLFVSLVVYNILLTINLVYTPRKLDLMIREVIFYFTEITVISKVSMLLFMREKIYVVFDLLDGDVLGVDDEISEKILTRTKKSYLLISKMYGIMSNIAYSSQVFIPIVLHFIFKSGVDLPICNYYFLTDELREKYFHFWFVYQSIGMYGHMMYNVCSDSFVAGLLYITVNQLQIIEQKLYSLQLTENENNLSFEEQEKIQMNRLKKILKRYDTLLIYCSTMQQIINITVFTQFLMASIIICVVMCGLLLPSSTESFVFMVMYLCTMTTQILVPGYLGTQITYASQELVFAAYNTDWIPRSESFKRSIRIFVERANTSIQISGLNMFSLSLTTFTSIMKSAYSFFTLIRSFQDG